MISEMMNNGGNPQALARQFIGRATPQQMQGIMQQAKQFGVQDNILSQLQNMK